MCPVRSVNTAGARHLDTILCQDLQTSFTIACCGVESIVSIGIMISSDCVREVPVLYRVMADLTLLEERQIVSRMEEILDKDAVGLYDDDSAFISSFADASSVSTVEGVCSLNSSNLGLCVGF